MAVNSFLSNQGTQSALLTDNTGGVAGTLIPVMKIATDAAGTFTSGGIWSGGITGTINSGSVVVTAGTIGSIPNTPGGTVNLVQTVSTVSSLTQGSITITAGTIGAGTINIGTMVGNIASGVTDSGNPIKIAGVFQGTAATVTDGQRVNLQTDNVGNLKVYLASTLSSANDSVTVGSGSIAITAGTIGAGTINTIGTLSNLLAGTIQNSGTVTGVGVVTNLTNGSIVVTAGTVSGLNASGAASSGNPLRIAGTDSGGTVYSFLTDTAGHMKNDMVTGTLTNGSIVVTAGTIASDTIVGGTVNLVTTVSNITNGSIHVTAGTEVVTGGSIAVTAGTINSGTLNAGTINAGTINTGTIRDDGRAARNIVSFGTQVALSSGTQGTIIGSASIGAGTSLWLQDMSIINPNGTILCILGFGTAQQGTNVLFRGVLGTQTTPGIEKSYAKAVNAGMTNTDLVFSTGAAGTIDLSISYFISA